MSTDTHTRTMVDGENKMYWATKYNGYWVSRDAKVISLKGARSRVMKIRTNQDGYRCLTTSQPGTGLKVLILSRLMCETFHGPCPEGHMTEFIDGDRSNCHADNLRWKRWKRKKGPG